MKKVFLILFIFPIIGFGQNVKPEIGESYITSNIGYAGCEDYNIFYKLLGAAVEGDVITYNRLISSENCRIIAGGEIVTLVNLRFENTIGELQFLNKKSTLFTTIDVLKPLH